MASTAISAKRIIATTRILYFEYSDRQRRALEKALDSCGSIYYDPKGSSRKAIELASCLPAKLKALVQAVVEGESALLIANAPQDETLSIAEYPYDGLRSYKKTFRSELHAVLLGCLADSRHFSNKYEKDNERFHNIVPRKEVAASQSNGSFLNVFEPHIENAGTVYRPDFVTLTGMLNGADAKTYVSSWSLAKQFMREEQVTCLRQKVAQFRVPESFVAVGEDRPWSVPSPIVEVTSYGERLSVAYDGTVRPLPEGAEAYGAARTALWMVRTGVVIRKGCVLFLNNENNPHARGPIQAEGRSPAPVRRMQAHGPVQAKGHEPVPVRWIQRAYFRRIDRALIESGLDLG